MVLCGIWDCRIVGFVQHVYSFLVRWCDSFTDVSSALLHWYLAIVWLLYKQTRRVWVKLFSAWTKPITANRQTLRAHVKIIPGTQCTRASYSWDTLYMYKLFMRYTAHVQVIPGTQCTSTSCSWDTVYMYKLFLGHSVHVQVIPGIHCTCTSSICVLVSLFASFKLYIKFKTAICFYVYIRQWLWANNCITCTIIFSIGVKV